LIKLPTQIGNLVNLVLIVADYNKFKNIPKNIGNLINLKGNKLEILPNNIGKLIKLKKFSISGNKLKILPRQIGNLINLKYFWIYDNPLNYISNIKFNKLVNLSKLYIYKKQIHLVPEGVKYEVFFNYNEKN
jgi:Leucine-rich repeat (LRR) protein